MCSSRWIFYLTEFTGIQAALIQSGSRGLVCRLDRFTMVETWYSAGLIIIHAYEVLLVLGVACSIVRTFHRAGNWIALNNFHTWLMSGATSERAWICLVTDRNV